MPVISPEAGDKLAVPHALPRQPQLTQMDRYKGSSQLCSVHIDAQLLTQASGCGLLTFVKFKKF